MVNSKREGKGKSGGKLEGEKREKPKAQLSVTDLRPATRTSGFSEMAPAYSTQRGVLACSGP